MRNRGDTGCENKKAKLKRLRKSAALGGLTGEVWRVFQPEERLVAVF